MLAKPLIWSITVFFSKILANRSLPLVIVRFFMSWYSMQKMQVRWDLSLSEPFSVSNGVHQGSVISPYLFLFTLMVCWLICVILVLDVTGVVPLLVRLVMPMMLYCWLLVPLQ
jgi:hypothetical protein